MENDDFYKSGLTEIRRARVWEVLVVGREESFVFSREILGLKNIFLTNFTLHKKISIWNLAVSDGGA